MGRIVAGRITTETSERCIAMGQEPITFVRWAADTITRSGHLRVFTPSSAIEDRNNTYQVDTEFFLKNKACSIFIREAGVDEFENGFDAALAMNLMHVYQHLPKLWILVLGNETL